MLCNSALSCRATSRAIINSMGCDSRLVRDPAPTTEFTCLFQEHLVAPVKKALNYYSHMGKVMEEELKKNHERKTSREEIQES